jgi:Cu-processing system ATP-binding protein
MKLQVEKIHKSFGVNEVLKSIDLLFKEGKTTAVLGPNGSGKTTLIKSVLNIVIPDKGDIKIGDQSTKNQWLYKAQINYLPQIARFPDNLRLRELIQMIKDIRGATDRDLYLAELFKLSSFMNYRMSHLSGGTRQKANIVLALMYDNPILILDEPSTGLDPASLIRFKDLIHEEKKKNKTILINTHIMSLVEDLADEIVFLLEGHIHFSGSVNELKEKYDEQNLERAIAKILDTEDV